MNVPKMWEIFSTYLGQKPIKLPLYCFFSMKGGEYRLIEKRFPADVQKELTFLKDKKIDAELYAYLQSVSYPENGDTVVKKSNLGTQSQICEKMTNYGKKMSIKTYRAHLNYLIERGYVIEETDQFILPPKEDIYLSLPLDTINFIQDTLKEPVIKTYIYLGQRYKYKKNYIFTEKEVAEHLGMNVVGNGSVYNRIRNYLYALRNNGLIDFECIYVNQVPRLKLTGWSVEFRTTR